MENGKNTAQIKNGEKKQITLRITGDLYEALKIESTKKDLTLNELIIFKLLDIEKKFNQFLHQG